MADLAALAQHSEPQQSHKVLLSSILFAQQSIEMLHVGCNTLVQCFHRLILLVVSASDNHLLEVSALVNE